MPTRRGEVCHAWDAQESWSIQRTGSIKSHWRRKSQAKPHLGTWEWPQKYSGLSVLEQLSLSDSRWRTHKQWPGGSLPSVCQTARSNSIYPPTVPLPQLPENEGAQTREIAQTAQEVRDALGDRDPRAQNISPNPFLPYNTSDRSCPIHMIPPRNQMPGKARTRKTCQLVQGWSWDLNKGSFAPVSATLCCLGNLFCVWTRPNQELKVIKAVFIPRIISILFQ